MIKLWKNQPSSQHVCGRVRANLALRLLWIFANFGIFLLKSASVFLRANFYLWGQKLATFRDQSTMLGKHLSQKLTPACTFDPLFGQKHPPGDQKMGQIFFPFLSKGHLNLLARYSAPPWKTRQNLFSSRSYKTLKFKFVCNQISPL